jgi:hypothetical protein
VFRFAERFFPVSKKLSVDLRGLRRRWADATGCKGKNNKNR